MKKLVAALALLIGSPMATAQDFYDIDVLRTVDLNFHDANWWPLLQQNYASQTEILADMTVEGVIYPDVGVRIRGNTSYFALPAGSQKVSLNIKVDFTHPDQEVMGHDTLNFNNAFLDPTFCREVVMSNILARWIPNGRANHINLTIGGQNWGVYANVQQYGKRVLKEYFENEDGLRIKCPNNPNGPGLQYQGTNPGSYGQYQIKDDGGLANPIQELIAVCNAVDNGNPANWQTIDQVVAIDPSIWTTVLENLYSDDDSYVNKGCDFVMYQNPADGRMHIHQTDGNESWTEEHWVADFHFNQQSKPFLNNVLSAPELRARYFAHMRVALEELDWLTLSAEFTARRNLIDAAVQADPKKLYTYQQFLNNFTSTVTLTGGFFGGPVVGLREYVQNRRTLLLGTPEVAAVPPTIQSVQASTNVAGVPVHVTASVTGTDPIAAVDLFYRPTPDVTYVALAMNDDGLSGDGAANDGVYGALLPFTGVGGQKVEYYARATAQNAFGAQSFLPQRTEIEPDVLTFQGGASPSDIVINEFLARNNTVITDPSGSFEDYVELYNKGAAPVDLSGMYMDDSLTGTPSWQIPAGTMLSPGQTLLIWADDDVSEGPLHADFKLSSGGEEIGLWAPDGTTLLDSLTFGPQEIDVSAGYLHDGGGVKVTFAAPTPGTPNDAGCGLRNYDQQDPFAHTLSLDTTGTGSLGTVVTLNGSGFQGSSPAFFAFDFFPAHFQTVQGPVVLMAGSVFFSIPTTPAGSFSLPLYIPTTPGLLNMDLYFQSFGTDAATNLSGSNAVHLSPCP